MISAAVDNPPLDFSFRNLTSVDLLGSTKPRHGQKRYRKFASGLYDCQALRLNNNQLTSIQGIYSVCQVLLKPENLTWLDLSFNRLTSLSSEITEFENLKILYLHGNLLKQLGKLLVSLSKLPHLYNLTLHGNPLAEHKEYRMRILSTLPQLRSIDFTSITISDKMFNTTKGNIKRKI